MLLLLLLCCCWLTNVSPHVDCKNITWICAA